MISDFRDWIRTAKGIDEYGIDSNVWYEIHIMYHYNNTDIITSNASLYIVRDCINDKDDEGKAFFERRLLFNGTLAECLEKAEKYKASRLTNENNN